jgi:NDMA-dependent alcohol dehydrogenase
LSTKTRAAVLRGPHQPYEVLELDLEGPRTGEVQVRVKAAGMCYSECHIQDAEGSVRFPMVGGHEASGVVESIGEGVTKVAIGDHVVLSYSPACGHCRYCSTGRQNLCDLNADALVGCLPDGTFRFHLPDGQDLGGVCSLGTFAERVVVSDASVIKIGEWLPFDAMALLGCGVPTGWGTAVNVGQVQPGDITVIFGTGGVGMNAVQGAALAGARHVICIDPVPFKREMAMTFGATHVFATAEEARATVTELSWGQGADQALCLPNVITSQIVTDAFSMVGKGGVVVITGVGDETENIIQVPANELAFWQKSIRGSLAGATNPQWDTIRLIRLYETKQLKLDELITRRYTLDQINEGYKDLRDGKNIRGIIEFE